MIDKQLEENIKGIKQFLEFWSKFHELYENTIRNDRSSKGEGDFISNQILVNSRFQDLMDAIGIKHANRLIKAFPIYELLSIKNLSEISDEKMGRIEDYWTDSYVFLSSLLSQFQKKKRRIEKFNKWVFEIKDFLRHVKSLRG